MKNAIFLKYTLELNVFDRIHNLRQGFGFNLYIHCISFLFIALFAVSLNSQVIHVTDYDTGIGIPGANIQLKPINFLTITDLNGYTDFIDISDVSEIVITAIGYKQINYLLNNEIYDTIAIPMQMSEYMLEQVVVSAGKWSQQKRDLAVSTSIVSKAETELKNPQTAADLLISAGHVFIQKSQMGGGSPMIRGFAANRVLIAVDGIRMNNAIFRSGNLQNVISLDPLMVERTEVIYGPGSIIYGSDAIGGVMGFLTTNPEFTKNDEKPKIGGKVLLRHSTANNERTGHIHIKTGGKKWAYLGSVSRVQFGDLTMGAYGPDDFLNTFFVIREEGADRMIQNDQMKIQIPTGYDQINIMQKLRWKPSIHTEVNYAFHHSETSDIPRYDRLIELTDAGFPRFAEWHYGPQKWQMHHLKMALLKPQKWFDGLTIHGAYQRFEESRRTRNFNRDSRIARQESVDVLSFNADAKKELGNIGQLYYGIEFIHNRVLSLGEMKNIRTGETGLTSRRYPDSEWQALSSYLTYQHKFSDKLSFQPGIRYNYIWMESRFEDVFFPLPFDNASLKNGALTGSLGLIYQPSQSWTMGINLATGFRAPNVDDVGKIFDSEPGAVVVPNPELRPEVAYNAEWNIKKTIEKWEINASVYYIWLKDALVRRDFRFNGLDSILYDGMLSRVQAVQNASNVYNTGFQLGFNWNMTPAFSMRSVFNYNFGREELDDGRTSPLRHAPPLFGQTQIQYKNSKLHVNVGVEYNGKINADQMPITELSKPAIYARDENNMLFSPSWYAMHCHVKYSLSKSILLTGALENITDRRYRPFGSGISAPGRNAVFSIHYNI